MRIAVPVTNGKFSMHFGHCEEFMLFDIKNGEIKKRTNVTPPPHEPGVLPKFLYEKGVTFIIAGGMGARAQGLFAQNGVNVIVGVIGEDPNDIVKSYLAGTLKTGANVCDH